MFAKRPEPLAQLRYLWATNAGAIDITLNSVRTLLDAAPDIGPAITIGCLDQASLDAFASRLPGATLIDIRAIPEWTRFAQVEVEGEYGDFYTMRFRDVSFARYYALMHMMDQRDTPILYADGDIAFRSDPRPHLAKAAATPDASVLIQSDLKLLPETLHDLDGRVIREPNARRNHCTGLTCWSDAARTRDLCERIIAGRRVQVQTSHDQQVLNSFAEEDLLDLASLPEELFLNGSYLFDLDGAFKFPEDVIKDRVAKACAVHANWVIGIANKTAALKSLGLWRL